jgi:hypothetical protein
MKRYNNLIIGIFLLYPYVVGFTPQASDSTSMIIKIIVGRGSYADISRDCEGRPITIVDIPFSEAAGEIAHQRGAVRAGMKGGVTRYEDGIGRRTDWGDRVPTVSGKTIYYINPHVGVQLEYIGLNAGLIYFSDEFAVHGDLEFDRRIVPNFSVQIGNPKSVFVTAGYLSNLPLISGGTFFDVGVGYGGIYPYRQVWFGLGFSPYDSIAIMAKGDIHLSRNILIIPRGLIGLSDTFQYGVSVGTAIVF